jgi:hypothetical protein
LIRIRPGIGAEALISDFLLAAPIGAISRAIEARAATTDTQVLPGATIATEWPMN